jgi:hypothetical protein
LRPRRKDSWVWAPIIFKPTASATAPASFESKATWNSTTGCCTVYISKGDALSLPTGPT